MRRAAIALAALPAVLLLFGAAVPQFLHRPMGGNPVFFSYPATSNSGLFADDANTVMHCYGEDFAAGTLTCTKGGAWTTVGSPSSDNATSPAYAVSGFGTARKGLTSLTSANYFSFGSAGNPLDFAGDFSVCVAYQPTSFASDQMPVSDAATGNNGGWWLDLARSASSFQIFSTSSGGVQCNAQDTVQEPLNGLSVACGGRSGTSNLLKVNLRTLITQAGCTATAGGVAANIGTIRNGTGGFGWNGRVFEIWASTTTASDAVFTAQEQRAFKEVADTGQLLSFARNSTASYRPILAGTTPPFIFTVPANVPRITNQGYLAEPPRTNLSIQSEAFDNAAWTKTSVTVTANSTQAPDGQTTADTLQSTVAGGDALGTTWSSAAAPYIATLWAKVASSTQAFDLRIRDTTGAADYVACNGLTATTTWQLFTCGSAANATAAHNLAVRVFPGGGAGTGTIIAWGAQAEQGLYATSYIPTAGTTVARVSDGGLIATGLADYEFGATVHFTWTPLFASTVAAGTTAQICTGGGFIYNNATGSIRGGSGGSSVIQAVTWAALGAVDVRARWDPTKTYLKTTGNSEGTNNGGIAAALTRIGIGENGACGTGDPAAYISNVCASRNAVVGCQ